MTEQALTGSRVLVVEDEYYLADEARSILARAGAEIIGPVPTLTQSQAALDANSVIDVALLDVSLRGDMVYALADALEARGVPFAFATGYDVDILPDRFSDRTVLEKPVRPEQLIQTITNLMPARDAMG